MHPFFLYEIQRQHMAEWEREAELRRIFMDDRREQRRERKRRFRLFSVSLRRPEQVKGGQALRTDAYACR